MLIKSIGIIFPIHMTFLYLGLSSFPAEQIGALAGALTVLTIGGLRAIKVR